MENDPATINQLEAIAKRNVKMLQYHLRPHGGSLNSGVRELASTLLHADVPQVLGHGIGWAKDLLWSLAVGTQSREYHVYKVLAMSCLTEEETVNDVLALAVLATAELSMSEYFSFFRYCPDCCSLRARCQLLSGARQQEVQGEDRRGSAEQLSYRSGGSRALCARSDSSGPSVSRCPT
jgi:hypothetical protein